MARQSTGKSKQAEKRRRVPRAQNRLERWGGGGAEESGVGKKGGVKWGEEKKVQKSKIKEASGERARKYKVWGVIST